MSGEPGEISQPEPKEPVENKSLLKRLFAKKPKQTQRDGPKSQIVPTKNLALSSQEESVETPISPLYSPEEDWGYTDENGKVVREKKKPTENELKEFFTPENIQRLVYCPRVNIAERDGWGIFGYEPGYIFVNERNYEGMRSLNDHVMIKGKGFDKKVTKSGHEILTVPHYDDFPQNKFGKQLLTLSRTPETFKFLRKLLDDVDSEDLSTYPVEDLDRRLKWVKRGCFPDKTQLDEAKKCRYHAKKAIEEEGDDERGKDLLEMADTYERRYRDDQDQVPENVRKYLEILEVASKRPEIRNMELLRLSASLPEQEKIIKDAIQQARGKGDEDLAKLIENLHEKTSPYIKNRLFLPDQEQIKQLEQK